jgi:hypothetical protein
MNTVLFAYREAELPPGPNLAGRPQIFDKLRQRELDPVISLLAEAAFTETGVTVHELEVGESETAGPSQNREVDELGLIVNRIGRSIKYDLLPEGANLPPMINENKTRSLAHRKHRMHDEVLEPLGIAIPTRLVTSIEDIEEFLAEQGVDEYVVKPDGGSESKGVQQLPAVRIADLFAANPDWMEEKKQIIQPAYDFTLPFPEHIRPLDIPSTGDFEGWSSSDAIKELRVYGFHSPAGTVVYPVARAMKQGDHWFFMDPESLPQALLAVSRQAIAKVAEIADAPAVLGTVDIGYGTLPGHAPEWRAVEVNAKQPNVVGYNRHPGVADHLRELLANQIHATVESNRRKSTERIA